MSLALAGRFPIPRLPGKSSRILTECLLYIRQYSSDMSESYRFTVLHIRRSKIVLRIQVTINVEM